MILYPFSKIILAEPITCLTTSSWAGLQNIDEFPIVDQALSPVIKQLAVSIVFMPVFHPWAYLACLVIVVCRVHA